jgi:hypothetical protein
MKNQNDIQSELVDFHKGKADIILATFSDIASNQFEGEFNVSGFHEKILALPNKVGSIWGIDRCLRIQDTPDNIHSFIFHMGIFARSINLGGDFIEPFKDSRFHSLQIETISQFLELLDLFNMDLGQIEITYLDQITFGGTSEGSDKLLKRKYDFPADDVSKNLLKDKVRLIPVKSLANLDISPVEGALVGPRLEVAYRGVEIGTIVFNCFKIERGNLTPINYVAGYAIGIERLVAALQDKNFLTSISRYQNARKILTKFSESADSSLFEKETLMVIYGAEVLAYLPKDLSRHQKERVRILRRNITDGLTALGVGEDALNQMTQNFSDTSIL